MSRSFTFLDLFAGIGGFHIALTALGGRCVLAAEIDEECQGIYRQAFPETRIEGDVRELTRAPRRIPDHDVLCAGFPCQPFSKSGTQLGTRDRTRGTLFFEIMEIVRAKQPRFVLLENVRNLAGPRHRDAWLTVIESLRDAGYGVADEPLIFSPHLLAPQLGGAPQIRDRVFILAERGRPSPAAPLVPYAPVGRWSPKRWRIEDYLTPDECIPNLKQYQLREVESQWLAAWQDFLEQLNSAELPGFPIWVDAFQRRLRIPDDTPKWKANFLAKNSALYARHHRWIDAWIRTYKVASFPPSRRKFEWQARGHLPDLSQLVIHFRPSGIRVKPPTYLPALVAITQTSIIGSRRRRITPREAARLQSFPEDFQLHPIDATAYRQLGNAVNAGVVKYLASALLNGIPQEQLLLELAS